MPKGYLVANIRVTDAEKVPSICWNGCSSDQRNMVVTVLARGPLADRHEGELSWYGYDD